MGSTDISSGILTDSLETTPLERWEASSKSSKRGSKRRSEKSILPDLERMPLPWEVKHRAEKIFHQFKTGTRRGRKRNQLIFICVHYAYQELEMVCDPKAIAEMIGLEPGKMNNATTMFSQLQTGYKPVTRKTSPLDLIPQYCRDIGLVEALTESAVEWAQGIVEKDPTLFEPYPQSVAAGLLKYYLTIHGMEIDSKTFAEKVHFSEATINAMYKRIARVDNA